MVVRQYLNQFRYVTEESAENLMIYMISIRKGRGEVVFSVGVSLAAAAWAKPGPGQFALKLVGSWNKTKAGWLLQLARASTGCAICISLETSGHALPHTRTLAHGTAAHRRFCSQGSNRNVSFGFLYNNELLKQDH